MQSILLHNVTDRIGALEAFKLTTVSLKAIQNVLTDGGYTGEAFATEVKNNLGASVQTIIWTRDRGKGDLIL